MKIINLLQSRLIAVPVLFAAVTLDARGALVVSYEEVGPNVVFTATGSINTGDLTITGNTANGGFIVPNSGIITSTDSAFLWTAANFTGPASYGTAGFATGTAAGTEWGIRQPGDSFPGLVLDAAYVSGSPISGTLTVPGSVASLGLAPSSTWNWGTAGNADSLTISAIPEPGTALLTILGLGIFSFSRRHRPWK